MTTVSIVVPCRNAAAALGRTLDWLETLRLDPHRHAERWRGPAHREPGSPWPRAPEGGRRRAA